MQHTIRKELNALENRLDQQLKMIEELREKQTRCYKIPEDAVIHGPEILIDEDPLALDRRAAELARLIKADAYAKRMNEAGFDHARHTREIKRQMQFLVGCNEPQVERRDMDRNNRRVRVRTDCADTYELYLDSIRIGVKKPYALGTLSIVNKGSTRLVTMQLATERFRDQGLSSYLMAEIAGMAARWQRHVRSGGAAEIVWAVGS